MPLNLLLNGNDFSERKVKRIIVKNYVHVQHMSSYEL